MKVIPASREELCNEDVDTCYPKTICGNGIVEPPEQCDDGNVEDGDCCNPDCQFEAGGSPCEDEAFCSYGDTCDGEGTFKPGAGNPCPVSLTCDEVYDRCVNCLFDEDCNDGIDCTLNFCDPDGNCQDIPDDTLCDDGAFCNGLELCDLLEGCLPGFDACLPPLVCDENQDRCASCLFDEECSDGINCTLDYCDPDGNCQHVADDTLCDDGVSCTSDTCDLSSDCRFIPDDAACDDGEFCNGWELCDPVAGCLTESEPCPPELDCDEDNDMCMESPDQPVFIDIKPGSCPNPVNIKDNGVQTVAVLGTDGFDVYTINPETALLGREGIPGEVNPSWWAYEDVATPFEGEQCGCHELKGDGYLDLVLKFETQELVTVLMFHEVLEEILPLKLTARLIDSVGATTIVGEDCIRVLGKCKGNFDCDVDVDGTDAHKFNSEFSRSPWTDPCTNGSPCEGDFDCDSDVDGTDTHKFKIHFGRNALVNACNACLEEDVCVYP